MSTNSPSPASNTLLLRRQLTELTKHPVEGFSAGSYPKILPQPFQRCPDSYLREGLVDENNFYEWDVMIIGFATFLVTSLCWHYPDANIRLCDQKPRGYPLVCIHARQLCSVS